MQAILVGQVAVLKQFFLDELFVLTQFVQDKLCAHCRFV
jgi:hypothetical protein